MITPCLVLFLVLTAQFLEAVSRTIRHRSRGCDEMPIRLQKELFEKGCRSLYNSSMPRYRAQPVFRRSLILDY
ncbi:unnamed protein product [Soboliphyme baturini]|uniref:Secreted protein n=1 Tax=Soboliphyme baturini TaxID=241478 RepID=A0A183IJI2_9BILA|nr:unnamed protein product [Soboliphyme baturini]